MLLGPAAAKRQSSGAPAAPPRKACRVAAAPMSDETFVKQARLHFARTEASCTIVGLQPTVIASSAPHLLLEKSVISNGRASPCRLTTYRHRFARAAPAPRAKRNEQRFKNRGSPVKHRPSTCTKIFSRAHMCILLVCQMPGCAAPFYVFLSSDRREATNSRPVHSC